MRQAFRHLFSVVALTALLAPVKPLLAAAPSPDPAPPAGHPRHIVKTWLTTYRGRTFRVTQLPRCEHMDAVISYAPRGETKERAKARLNGVAVSTGAFHNPSSMALADFYQRDGSIRSSATTGRWFFAIMDNGEMHLSGDYALLKGRSGVTALALGQRLVPFHRDGFSKAFINQVTDRMALGMSDDYIFIVQGKSDLWRLSDFIRKKLPCHIALNADGGHVVRGKAPVHIVFRWRPPAAAPASNPTQLDTVQIPATPPASDS